MTHAALQRTVWMALLACMLAYAPSALLAKTTKRFLDRAEVHAFINEMAHKHHYSKQELTRYFARAKFQDDVLTAISHPYEAKPWFKYRETFLSDVRIQGGVRFWNEHQATLAEAERRYGVPAEIIVAILGVESIYGKNTGKYSVFDSLATLAFGYPSRSKFFRSELEQYLLLTREEGLDPFLIKGSYAGAMGAPQFIASSYRHYAIDFRGKGKRDLLNNWEDVIGSVANYFKANGWVPHAPIAQPAVVKSTVDHLAANAKEPKPTLSAAQLRQAGVEVPKGLEGHKLALVVLEAQSGPEYHLGLQNFYVITRYNRSNNYAMAVYQLSQKIKAAR